MKLARLLLNLALVLSFGFSPLAGAAEDAPIRGSLQTESIEAGAPSLKVDFEYKEIAADDTEAELGRTLQDASRTQDLVVVSTDDNAVIEQASREKVALIPFGRAIRKAADLANGINTHIRNYPAYAANVYRTDKIGLGITLFSVGNDVVRWIHVSNASTFTMTANIIYSTLWTAAFLDKDTWSKVTRPIQKTYRRLFKMSEVIPEVTSPSDMAIKFLSGATLSVGMNSIRAAIIGIDQLAHHTFAPMNIAMPIFMGIVMTSVGFSWAELTGSIKTELYPRAKRIVKLTMNSRSLLTSYFAASAMLMNPETFGIRPWIIVSVSGAAGLITYANARHLLPKIEKFGKRIERFVPIVRPRPLTCEAIW